MKFAEKNQEVQVDFALPPVRRKDNNIFKRAYGRWPQPII
jgi:hypothetical protein